AQFRRVRTMLRTLPVERAPRDLLAKVRGRVEQKTFLERMTGAFGGFRVPRLAVSGALATAAVLFLAFSVVFNNKGSFRSPAPSTSSGSAIADRELQPPEPKANDGAERDEQLAFNDKLDGHLRQGPGRGRRSPA